MAQTKRKIFDLNCAKGSVHLTKSIVLKPFELREIQGNMRVWGHYKQVCTITDPMDNSYIKYVTTLPQNTQLKAQSSQVAVTLRNLSAREVKISIRTVVGKISVANAVLNACS